MAPRAPAVAVCAALALTLVSCAGAPSPRPTSAVVADALGTASSSAVQHQAQEVAAAAVRLVAGERAAPPGWVLQPLSDVAEGVALVEQARPSTGAGVVAVRGRGAKGVVLAVPVPGGAAPAEGVGVDLFVRSRAIALVVAGTPTAAAASGSTFEAVTAALTDRGLLLAVVEGFAPDADGVSPEVVLRGATERPSDEELRIGIVLAAAGVETCVLVAEECIDPNVALGEAEAPAGPVVRLQLAGRLLTDAARRAAVVGEVAKALDDL